MPTYDYQCPHCHQQFDVAKRVALIDQVELCPKCQGPCDKDTRIIVRTHFYGASDWDKAEFNPGLGCVTRNGAHRRRLAKERGLEEIGNDYRSAESHYHDNERRRQERLDHAYDSI